MLALLPFLFHRWFVGLAARSAFAFGVLCAIAVGAPRLLHPAEPMLEGALFGLECLVAAGCCQLECEATRRVLRVTL